MRKSTRIAATVASAGLLAAAMAAPAGAAPSKKGMTTIVPNDTTLSVLKAVLAPGSAAMDGEDVTAAFGITGNPASGVIKHVGGLAIDGSAGITKDSYLEIRNFWIKGTSVSGDVENVGRVDLFTLSGVQVTGSTITATLNFTAVASLAAVGSTDLEGDPAGTATVVLK